MRSTQKVRESSGLCAWVKNPYCGGSAMFLYDRSVECGGQMALRSLLMELNGDSMSPIFTLIGTGLRSQRNITGTVGRLLRLQNTAHRHKELHCQLTVMFSS